MNLIEAKIFNHYCTEHPEALLVISQANRTLAVYYENKKGNIGHKFGGIKKHDSDGDLEPGSIWVNLQRFKQSFSKLIKYFHPDYYKGKRTDNEIKNIIEILTQLSRTSKNHSLGAIREELCGVGHEPTHELTDINYGRCTFMGILRSGDPIGQLQNWCAHYRFDQAHLYGQDQYQTIKPRWFANRGMEDRRRYSKPCVHDSLLEELRPVLPKWWGKDYESTSKPVEGYFQEAWA